LTPDFIRECVEEYQRDKPDLGRRYTARLTPYQIDRLPPGIVLVACPVCGASFHGMKAGDFALVAVFSFRAEKIPGASIVFTFPVCPTCARKEAPALAAEIYPA
jgi:hypothetical protein